MASAAYLALCRVLYLIAGIGVDTYSLGCLVLFAVPFVIGLVQIVRYVKSLTRQTP